MIKNKSYKWPTKLIIVLFSTIASFIVFSVVISIITLNLSKDIEKEQLNIFNETTLKIKKILTEGKDYSYLNTFSMEGYRIVITNSDGNIVYPKINVSPNILGFNTLLGPAKGKYTNFKVNDLNINVSYPVQLTPPDIRNIIFNSIPYVLFSTVLSIVIIITIYLSLFDREKKKLSTLFELTKKGASNTMIVNLNSNMRLREYAEIEIQVKDLYLELNSAKNKLKKEVGLVKKIETNNSALLKGMTHELKTPLMSVKLLIDQLEDSGLKDNSKIFLSEINNQLNILNQLIREILFISQKNNISGHSKQSSTQIMNEVIHNYEILLEDKGLILSCNFKNDFYLELDRKIIEKVFSNLVSNAINYSVENSIISVEITENKMEIKNKIQSFNINDFEVIGKPFVTFDSQSGTGLGIYLIETMLINSSYDLDFKIEEKNFFVVTLENK